MIEEADKVLGNREKHRVRTEENRAQAEADLNIAAEEARKGK